MFLNAFFQRHQLNGCELSNWCNDFNFDEMTHKVGANRYEMNVNIRFFSSLKYTQKEYVYLRFDVSKCWTIKFIIKCDLLSRTISLLWQTIRSLDILFLDIFVEYNFKHRNRFCDAKSRKYWRDRFYATNPDNKHVNMWISITSADFACCTHTLYCDGVYACGLRTLRKQFVNDNLKCEHYSPKWNNYSLKNWK